MSEKPKILLINYTKSDADAIKKSTGLNVLRGYLSEEETIRITGIESKTITRFYSPEAYYECAMIFFNLPANKELKEEFNSLACDLTQEDAGNMLRYWRAKKHLTVIFAGNTNINDLRTIGIVQLLKKSSGNDTSTTLRIGEDNKLYDLANMLEKQIKMPSDKYILGGLKKSKDTSDPYYGFGTHWNTYITNANGDALVCSLSKNNTDWSGENPGILTLPVPKGISRTTTKIIEFFGEHFDIYTPGSDWQDSDKFYPQTELVRLTKEIDEIQHKAQAEMVKKLALLKSHKEKWEFLKELTTTQGDKLVDAVYRVLVDVLSLKVTKSDDENKGEPIEDLLVEFDDRKVLLEVKGTTKPNAPLEYTQQPFQHIVRRGYDGKVEAGLILNHDMKNDPQFRKEAYTDKDKEGLITNLYFIDTYTLLNVALAVIDKKLTKEDAQNILFASLGRVNYEPK